MKNQNSYKDFIQRLRLLVKKRPDLIITALSDIFTMRLIANKTHGDPAEIAIKEFINQYMYDFRSEHIGKELYRSKSYGEDIKKSTQADRLLHCFLGRPRAFKKSLA